LEADRNSRAVDWFRWGSAAGPGMLLDVFSQLLAIMKISRVFEIGGYESFETQFSD
jgi:hypothetical protein